MSVSKSEVYSVIRAIREGYILIEDLIMLSETEDFSVADADSIIDKVSMEIREHIENNDE